MTLQEIDAQIFQIADSMGLTTRQLLDNLDIVDSEIAEMMIPLLRNKIDTLKKSFYEKNPPNVLLFSKPKRILYER